MNKVRDNQEKIYKELYQKHKGEPMAVSSESFAHKKQRYDIISRIFEKDTAFTLHDVGMGLADFKKYLNEHHSEKNIIYSGSEILEEFVADSKKMYPDCEFHHRDVSEQSFPEVYDYVMMSGVFHQRRSTKIKDWELFSQEMISNAFKMCRKGLAFNFISPFVDFYQTEVYYCNLPKLIQFVNDDVSRFFQIHHDYALFEFTVFVYKEEFILQNSPQPEFQKYFQLK